MNDYCHPVRILLAAATLFGLATSSAQAGSWREQSHPSVAGKDEYLWDTIAFAGNNAWAAGYRYGPVGGSYEFRTLVLRWNGFEWSGSPTIDIESAPAKNFLRGIGGTSSNDVWVVGNYTPRGAPSHSLIEHWDGAQWRIVDTPTPPPGGAYLEKVAAGSATDAWAIGNTYELATRESPLALHWNGSVWASIPVPAVPGCLQGTLLTDVAVKINGIAYATGNCLVEGGNDQGFVLRWNRTRWTVVQRPDQLTGETRLNSVTFAGGDEIWVAGDRDYGDRIVPLLLHYDAITGWTERALPEGLAGRYPSIHALAASGPNQVWAVGETNTTPPSGLVVPLTLRWDGTSWSRHPAGEAQKMFGVSVVKQGRAFGVGLYQQSGRSLIQTRRDPPAP